MCVPESVVGNEELAGRLGLTPEQIFKSSGISRRRWAEKGVTTGSLAARALELALEDAGLAAGDVDYLLLGTMTPDRFIPGTAPSVQRQLGLGEIPCLDIRAACCNALYGMQLASALVQSGAARRVAICLAEIQSRWLDLSPESGAISMLFGDGAAALVVSAEDEHAPGWPIEDEAEDKSDQDKKGALLSVRAAAKDEKPGLEIIDVLLATNGSYVDDLGVRCPGTEFGVVQGAGASDEEGASPADFRPRMVGQSVILQASRKIVSACQAVLRRQGLEAGDVRWMVPHQANANLLAQVARGLRFPQGWDGLVSVIEDYANTSSASMGLALDALRRSGRVEPGDYLLLPAFGAGFTWGAALCRATTRKDLERGQG